MDSKMTASPENAAATSGDIALRRIAEREEILEICYWYRGEGFGERFTVTALAPFLAKGQEEIGAIMESLVAEGALLRDGPGYRRRYFPRPRASTRTAILSGAGGAIVGAPRRGVAAQEPRSGVRHVPDPYSLTPIPQP